MGMFGATELVREIGNSVDKIFTSDDERLSKEIAKDRLYVLLAEKQISLNENDGKNSNIFISGWRPAIGWICAIAFLYQYLLVPIMASFGTELSLINLEELHTLLFGMLGFGVFRTVEKMKHK